VKTLRKQCAIAILTLMLAISTYAGQIDTPGVVSGNGTPPSPLANVVTSVIVTVVTLVP